MRLFVEAHEFEAFGLGAGGAGVGDGGLEVGCIVIVGVGLRIGDLFGGQGVDVHFVGAETVEPPGVPGDGVGEFAFGDGLGGEVGYVFGFELFEDGAIAVGEGE